MRASGNDPNTITNALSPGSSDGGPTRQAGCAVLRWYYDGTTGWLKYFSTKSVD